MQTETVRERQWIDDNPDQDPDDAADTVGLVVPVTPSYRSEDGVSVL